MSMGNVNPNLFRQAQSVQKRLMDLREELKDRVVEGEAGGGLVTAFTNGNGELVKITIKKEAVDPADVSMLEDLVVAAVQKGLEESQKLQQTEMQKVTGGMHIPGIF
ncbi:MAG: YbaB/EbfC family nucleoid-associated protein [Planctomycetes bacterium]|nr:YbaB/EbfC family nucleoid-associated protein [Planctomycetota bacterium]